MNNNLENKSRFFALYWGQEIYRNIYWVQEESKIEIRSNVMQTLGNISNGILILKPLSSITDEDAIEVSSILGIDNEAMVHHGRLFVDRIMGKRAGNSQDNCYLTYTSMWACDYLRSKGYALPFMGESIETLIKYGWIKLIN